MNISTLGQIVFFLAFGINFFWPFLYGGAVTAIAALVVGGYLLLTSIFTNKFKSRNND